MQLWDMVNDDMNYVQKDYPLTVLKCNSINGVAYAKLKTKFVSDLWVGNSNGHGFVLFILFFLI